MERKLEVNPKMNMKALCHDVAASETNFLVSTVKRVLHQHGQRDYNAKKKPVLKKWRRKDKLNFAKEYQDEDLWKSKILFGNNNQEYVFRRKTKYFNSTMTSQISSLVGEV